MSANPPDSNPPRQGGLQAMLARLRGMVSTLKPPEEATPPTPLGVEEAPPTLPPDEPAAPAVAEPVPAAVPEEAPPLAAPVAEEVAAPSGNGATEPAVVEPVAPTAPAALPPCPVCGAPRNDTASYCDSCGYVFPAAAAAPAAAASKAAPAAAPRLLGDRYELGTLLGERGGVSRFLGVDRGDGAPQQVTILRMERPAAIEAVATAVTDLGEGALTDEDIMPGFDEPSAVADTGVISRPSWPSIGWERDLLDIAQNHPGLPTILDTFVDGNYEYLIEEYPEGQLLWDAWDDPDAGPRQRFTWLRQVAEALHALHQGGAILEGLRPDIVVVTPSGQAKIRDLADLLPLPVPATAPLRASLYTAPELLANPETADARSDLYSFGAMLYALHLGRELVEKDFEKPGQPKPFIPHNPDCHPAMGRLMSKTLTKDLSWRFPTDEAGKEDPTGFKELINVLEATGRAMDVARLEISAWTTTGMVRTGNEDAFALLHSVESRIDDTAEYALLLLADGMGGYEAGEVAAQLAIQALRRNLVQQKPFRALAGAASFKIEGQKDPPETVEPAEPEAIKKLIAAALADANQQVFTASRSGVGRRGMGCTAEVVYVDGRNVVVGHVGDSRTYLIHQGRLIQMTRDQTLVNRLVELGQLTPEEAETHPRRNELQQAIGGQPRVEPGLYTGKLQSGDWVVVCSDGVTNHVKPDELSQMLLVEANSADQAARRLVNYVNINGATDNATIVVIRAV
jgi:serine/threonine protein phosphatase PrpC